jgi:hypothetical protein
MSATADAGHLGPAQLSGVFPSTALLQGQQLIVRPGTGAHRGVETPGLDVAGPERPGVPAGIDSRRAKLESPTGTSPIEPTRVRLGRAGSPLASTTTA